MTIISLCFKPSWQTEISKPFLLFFPALVLGGCKNKNWMLMTLQGLGSWRFPCIDPLPECVV